jgi:hypothetical protein
VIGLAELVAWIPSATPLPAKPATVVREHKGARRNIDVAAFLVEARWCDAVEAAPLLRSLGWPEGGALLRTVVRVAHDGGIRPAEVVEALTGARPDETVRYARLGLRSVDGGDAWARAMPPAVTAVDPPGSHSGTLDSRGGVLG